MKITDHDLRLLEKLPICPMCNKKFIPNVSTQKYDPVCRVKNSKEIARKWKKEWHKKRKELNKKNI